MNTVTVIWSAMAGACLMLALLHLAIWCSDRRALANLWFFVTVLGVLGLIMGEMVTMSAGSTAGYGSGLRYAHLVYFFCVAGIVGFVRCHFGTGRLLFMVPAIALRLLAVVANFTTGQSLHVAEIRSIRTMVFLGEEVTVLGDWVANRWVLLGQGASLLLVVYVLDASLSLWRKGPGEGRRRAVAMGGGLTFFIIAAAVQSGLVAAGVLKMPFLVSLPFLGMVLAMGYELSRDVLRAARLSHELADSKERLKLAAERFRRVIEAARSAMVMTDPAGKIVLVNVQTEKVFGYARADLLEKTIGLLLPACADGLPEISDGESFGRRKDGTEVTVEIRLSPIEMPEGRFMLASILDITDRKRAELNSARQQQELAHLSRISILGELAGALAHELNQPLAAILGNAQVGSAGLRSGPPDLVETAAILDDIADDAKRAGGIIHGMRAMFKKEPVVKLLPLDLNEKVHKVLNLMHSEIVTRRVKIALHLDPSLPLARASRVETQQILINLVVNALDAMKGTAAESRNLEITTRSTGGQVFLCVRDTGPGIPENMADRLFEPFVSTKKGGLGLGLAISRNIARRFDGELHAENHPESGAVFQLVLPSAGDKPCQ